MANQFSGNVFEKVTDETRQGEVLQGIEQGGKKMYLESYGCQMNFSDSEIVASIMSENGYSSTSNLQEADVVFINTCSIRENAEQKVRGRLDVFRLAKKQKPEMVIGVLGCMAERMKAKLLDEEKVVDLVIGPDAYKDLPNLLDQVESGQKAVNVILSREETYADVTPVRLGGNGVLAFVTIMRGCDNMCSFCVVPFTRGRERSRDAHSIVAECRDLFEKGYKEVTLLGQNVDSYHWSNETENVNFAQLLERVALISPLLRVRFSTSHPKDITDEVLETIAKYENICKCIHLPVQSGSTYCLERMNRTYSREWYMNRVDAIRRILPDCAITSDVIAGFCGETEEEHADTLSILDYVKYDMSYMFKYSERPGTFAARKYADDILEDVKSRRLDEIIAKQSGHALERNKEAIGQTQKILVEGFAKKGNHQQCGRNTQNKMVVFATQENVQPGDYVMITIDDCSQATLFGTFIEKL
jgi:tRNA-2-methylthio-N6-dimethylallyladenosine synthase